MIYIISLVAAFGHADSLQISNVTGASRFDLGDRVIVYGGQAGSACESRDPDSPCDNCGREPGENCNARRIFDGLRLSIKVASPTRGPLRVLRNGANLSILESNDDGGVTFSWRDVCRGVDGLGADCRSVGKMRSSASVDVVVYEDANNNGRRDPGEPATPVTFRILSPGPLDGIDDGLQDYDLRVRMGRVFVLNPMVNEDFPRLGYGTRVIAIRALFTDEAGVAGVQDLPIAPTSGALLGNALTALEPGRGYRVRLGVIDEAGNLTHVTPERFVRP